MKFKVAMNGFLLCHIDKADKTIFMNLICLAFTAINSYMKLILNILPSNLLFKIIGFKLFR